MESLQEHPTVIVRISRTFWEDHDSRDLIGGKLVKVGKRIGTVEINYHELRELISDSYHYSWFYGEDYQENKWICDSAKTVFANLSKVEGPPECDCDYENLLAAIEEEVV